MAYYYKPPRRKHNPTRFMLIMLALAVIFFVLTEFYRLYAGDKINNIGNNKNTQTTNTNINNNKNANFNTNLGSTIVPEKASLKVPFTTQAPFANWDAVHEEACEEASLIMYKHFNDGTDIASTEQAEEEIEDLISYENANGYKVDVTVSQLKEIAEKHYGMKNGRVITNISIDDIKKEIAAGHPVIVPAAGKILPNPNFRNGGPLYHMLVVKGYDKDGWVTNDPGTRKGEHFRYTYDGLYNAIHDWNESDIMAGGKNILVFDK